MHTTHFSCFERDTLQLISQLYQESSPISRQLAPLQLRRLPLILAAHSFGGLVALHVAQRLSSAELRQALGVPPLSALIACAPAIWAHPRNYQIHFVAAATMINRIVPRLVILRLGRSSQRPTRNRPHIAKGAAAAAEPVADPLLHTGFLRMRFASQTLQAQRQIQQTVADKTIRSQVNVTRRSSVDLTPQPTPRSVALDDIKIESASPVSSSIRSESSAELSQLELAPPQVEVIRVTSTIARRTNLMSLITCPVLLLHGTADRLIPFTMSSQIVFESVSSQRRQISLFPNGIHHLWGDPQWQSRLPQEILEFLNLPKI